MRGRSSFEYRKTPTPSQAACLTLANGRRLARTGPHNEGTRPPVVEEISLNKQFGGHVIEGKLYRGRVVCQTRQLTAGTVEVKGATKSLL